MVLFRAIYFVHPLSERHMDLLYRELIQRIRDISVLSSCGSLLGWDERTYLPSAGAAYRGDQLALLARLGHEMLTDRRIGELLQSLAGSELTRDPDSESAANIREIQRTYNRAVKLPKELVEELARVTTGAQRAWQNARHAGNFSEFQPWLEKIVALKRQEAQAVGFSDQPYDALLDEFEPGMTTARVQSIFAQLARELVPLVQAIQDSKIQPDSTILERDFPVREQEFFGRAAAAAIGFNFEAGRLDTTTHPFCSGIGPGDCRITTRYNPNFFNESFFGILHEAGHGIYEQNLPDQHHGTPLGSAASYGIHESQSRLWENQVGRGRAFWQHFFPRAKQTFSALNDVKFDDWLLAINAVRPSFIRVEADEATYNLHIILRFELEQALLTGDLSVADLPGAWNEKSRKLLGIEPSNDSLGCLQDIHWSFGGLGYFPTYTLGNLYSAQFMEAAQRELPVLEQEFSRGEFGRLKTWLIEKIHKHGQRYRAEALCERVTGSPLEHRPFVSYLKNKYASLYGLSGD